MEQRRFLYSALGILFLLPVCTQAPVDTVGADWRFLYQEQNISVYRNNERPPSFRAEGNLSVDMFQALAVLADFDRRPEWVANLSEIRQVEGDPEDTVLLYSVFDLPWPFKDRDSLVEGTVDIDYESLEVVIAFRRATHPQYPERRDRIRMPVVEGEYFLRYIDEATMFAAYELKMDSGGRLPRWIAKFFIKKAPVRTLAAFRMQVLKTRGEYDEFIDRHRQRSAAYHEEMD